MKRVTQKLTSISLAAVMMLAPTVAHAEDREYSSLGAASVTCQASVSESFTVKLPASLTLNNNQAASLPVSVKGNLVAGHSIKVVPEDTVQMQYMASNGTYTKDPVDATVTAGKTEWTSTELSSGEYVQDNATSVMVSGLSAGHWVGSLAYNISLIDKNIASGGGEEDEGEDEEETVNYSTSDNGLSYYSAEGKYYVKAEAANILDVANNYTTLTVSGANVDVSNIYYNVEVPADTTEVEENAFSDTYYDVHMGELTGTQISADHITKVTLPSGLTTVGASAFAGTGIEKITIPDSVTTIQKAPFTGCASLKAVYTDGTIDTYSDDTGTTFAQHVTSVGAQLVCKNSYKYYIDSDTEELVMCVKASNNADIETAINNGMPTSVVLPGDSEATNVTYYDVTVPSGTTEIEACAFAYGVDEDEIGYEYAILNVNMPDSVKTIGNSAFCAQKLKKIQLPNQLETIGQVAFSCCYNEFTSEYDLVIPASVKEIGSLAFDYCKNIRSVDMRDCAVTKIEGGTFHYCCKLSELLLPTSVSSLELGEGIIENTIIASLVIPNVTNVIHAKAFSGCEGSFYGVALTSIYYSGPVEDDGTHWGATSATVYANNT